MADALEELSHLCECLQDRSITLPRAQRLIKRQIDVLTGRKANGGEHYNEVIKCIEVGSFRDVQVSFVRGRQKEINPAQFYQSLLDS